MGNMGLFDVVDEAYQQDRMRHQQNRELTKEEKKLVDDTEKKDQEKGKVNEVVDSPEQQKQHIEKAVQEGDDYILDSIEQRKKIQEKFDRSVSELNISSDIVESIRKKEERNFDSVAVKRDTALHKWKSGVAGVLALLSVEAMSVNESKASGRYAEQQPKTNQLSQSEGIPRDLIQGEVIQHEEVGTEGESTVTHEDNDSIYYTDDIDEEDDEHNEDRENMDLDDSSFNENRSKESEELWKMERERIQSELNRDIITLNTPDEVIEYLVKRSQKDAFETVVISGETADGKVIVFSVNPTQHRKGGYPELGEHSKDLIQEHPDIVRIFVDHNHPKRVLSELGYICGECGENTPTSVQDVFFQVSVDSGAGFSWVRDFWRDIPYVYRVATGKGVWESSIEGTKFGELERIFRVATKKLLQGKDKNQFLASLGSGSDQDRKEKFEKLLLHEMGSEASRLNFIPAFIREYQEEQVRLGSSKAETDAFTEKYKQFFILKFTPIDTKTNKLMKEDSIHWNVSGFGFTDKQ